MAAPLSTSCLQRWTLLQEAAQCSGVLEWRAGEGTVGTGQAGQGPPGPCWVEPHGLMAWFLVPRCLSAGALPSGPAKLPTASRRTAGPLGMGAVPSWGGGGRRSVYLATM